MYKDKFWTPPPPWPNFGRPSISVEFPCGFLEIFCRIVGCPPPPREFLSTPEMEKTHNIGINGFTAANMLPPAGLDLMISGLRTL